MTKKSAHARKIVYSTSPEGNLSGLARPEVGNQAEYMPSAKTPKRMAAREAAR